MLLVDELEHGLEPHRIIRFLGSLGAKEVEPPLQVFMTTHSPVALRDLSDCAAAMTFRRLISEIEASLRNARPTVQRETPLLRQRHLRNRQELGFSVFVRFHLRTQKHSSLLFFVNFSTRNKNCSTCRCTTAIDIPAKWQQELHYRTDAKKRMREIREGGMWCFVLPFLDVAVLGKCMPPIVACY
jgi:hypothetical protein